MFRFSRAQAFEVALRKTSSAIVVQIHKFWCKVSRISAIFTENIKISQILKFPEISQWRLQNFQKMNFEKLEKNVLEKIRSKLELD